VMRVLRTIEHVTKAGTAARSAGYRVSYLDRAMTEGNSFSTVHRCDYGHARVWAEALVFSDVMGFCIFAFLHFCSSGLLVHLRFFWRKNASPRSSASTPTSPTCAKICGDSVSQLA